MAINVGWDNAQHSALRFEINGSWDWDELRKANVRAKRLMDSVTHKVSIIFDLQRGDWLPTGAARPRKRSIPAEIHPNYAGVQVLVGIHELTDTFDCIRRKYGTETEEEIHVAKTYFVPTLEAAREVLQKSA